MAIRVVSAEELNARKDTKERARDLSEGIGIPLVSCIGLANPLETVLQGPQTSHIMEIHAIPNTLPLTPTPFRTHCYLE